MGKKNPKQPTETKQKNIIKSGNKHTIYLFYVQFYKKDKPVKQSQ